MSSLTTSIPTGPIPEWCLMLTTPRRTLFYPACVEPFGNGTAINANGFQSICCDGVIVDTALDMYNASPFPGSVPGDNATLVDLSDLMCCGVTGTQTEALNPTPSPRTACAPGTIGTPLASLAATNASKADQYPVTYAGSTPSSSGASRANTDLWGWANPTYGASGTPMCFFVNTASGVSIAEVTVPATYTAPSTSATDSSPAAASTSSPNAGFSALGTRSRSRVYVALGLMGLSLLA
ncbi:hypothetical protein F4677DRAFT_414383 [Hypoxylon crocopeplum]|nr:hypothetical protein F4677DRAFT_414383 [Hypoxylon crocopeplum]